MMLIVERFILLIINNGILHHLKDKTILMYTDGSCNPVYRIGGWASVIFIGEDKIALQNVVENATHQHMELMAVIESIRHIESRILNNNIIVYTDSQYVVGIMDRKDKLKEANFLTKRNEPIQNAMLVKNLIGYIELYPITFVKVKAHQKTAGENINREVDKASRQVVRKQIALLARQERS